MLKRREFINDGMFGRTYQINPEDEIIIMEKECLKTRDAHGRERILGKLIDSFQDGYNYLDEVDGVMYEICDDYNAKLMRKAYAVENTVDIFKNYGIIGAEKRNVYSAYAPASDIFECITVQAPEEVDFFCAEGGHLFVTFKDSKYVYELYEVLFGNEYPHFEYINKDEKLRRIRLEEVKKED